MFAESWKRKAEEHFEEDLDVKELFEELTGRHARTFPVWLPMLPMDRIYYRGVEPVNCACLDSGPWRRMSDHAALTGTYRLQRQAGVEQKLASVAK